MSIDMIIIMVISSTLAALLARSRNRTMWKGAIVGIVPATLILMIIFLKPKGQRTKKNILIDRGIIGFFLLLTIGVFSANLYFKNKLKNNKNFYIVGRKLNFIDQINKKAPETISFSGYYDTLFLTLSLEEEARKENRPYSLIEKEFKKGKTTSCTEVYYEWYLNESPTFLKKLKDIGYKYFQAKVLYKNGTIEKSKIIKFNTSL